MQSLYIMKMKCKSVRVMIKASNNKYLSSNRGQRSVVGERSGSGEWLWVGDEQWWVGGEWLSLGGEWLSLGGERCR